MRTLSAIPVLSQRDRTLLRRITREVRRVIPSASMLLYGSTARGDRTLDSDFDLLILTNQPISEREEEAVHDGLYELELSHGVVISAMFYTRDDWNAPLNAATPFHQRVEEDAIAL